MAKGLPKHFNLRVGILAPVSAGLLLFGITAASAEEPIDSPLSRQAASTTTETTPFEYKLKHPDGLTLLYNGCRGSRIEPCGCRALNLGGIDREAAMIQTIRRENPNSVFVDAGGLFREFTDPPMRLATWQMMDALAQLNCRAINIGYPDLRQGMATLKDFEQRWNLPFISANIVNADSGKPMFTPYLSIEVPRADGSRIRLGIVGVTATNKDESHGLAPDAGPAKSDQPAKLDLSMPNQQGAGRWMIAESNGRIPWLPYNIHDASHGTGGAAATPGPGGTLSPAVQFATTGETAVTSGSVAPYRVADFVESAREVGAQLRPDHDYLVLMAYTSYRNAAKLAPELSDYDLVIAADYIDRVEPIRPVPDGPLVIGGDHDGKYLGVVEVTTSATEGMQAQTTPDLLPILQSIKPLPEYTKYIANFAADTEALPVEQPVTPAEKKYAGVTSCKTCHVEAYTQWKGHHHARAMKALVDKDMHYNPDCLKCHTVAYRMPGGFTDLRVTANLANVQCEVCHGPGEAHVKEMRMLDTLKREGKPVPAASEVLKMDWDQNFCMQCHDPQNDPQFNFVEDIQRVRHKNPAPARERPTTVSLMM